MKQLRDLLRRGLDGTAAAWPPIQQACGWVHRAAGVLKNEEGLSSRRVRRRYRGVLGTMRRRRHQAADLAPAVDHFLKVTRSYWPGLFHCYDRPDLPRTNNDLEHLFGSHRYHERRASGRKTASPSTVLRGSVRLVAAAATRLQRFESRDLTPVDLHAWAALRQRLEHQRHARILRTRFRRNPHAYLHEIEKNFLQQALPP